MESPQQADVIVEQMWDFMFIVGGMPTKIVHHEATLHKLCKLLVMHLLLLLLVWKLTQVMKM
jgi:hypothetical protein